MNEIVEEAARIARESRRQHGSHGMNRNIPRDLLKLYRNLQITYQTFDKSFDDFAKVAETPQLIDDARTRYGGDRRCDGCFGTGFSHMFREFSTEVAADGCVLCAPCFMQIQLGTCPCESIVTANFFDVKVSCEKLANPMMITDRSGLHAQCNNCSRRTKTWFRNGERDLCPICYTISEKGSIFEEDIVQTLERLTTLRSVEGMPEADVRRAEAVHNFLRIWDGFGNFNAHLQAWLLENDPELVPQQVIVVDQNVDLSANTSSSA